MATTLDPKFVRRGLTLVFITLFLDVVGIAIIAPVMPEYLGQLTGDDVSSASIDGGVLLMVYSAMQFIFAPLIGNLSDRFGRRPILLISIITFALDNLICAIAWSYSMLFIGRILAGVSGASFSTCSAYIADVSNDSNRTRNFGLIGIAFGAGFVLGPLIGGFLGELGPRVPFYFAAGLSFLNFIFAWFMLPETLSKRNRRRFEIKRSNPLGTLISLHKYPSVLWISLAFAFYWLAITVWPSAWAFISKARYNWSEMAIGASFGTFGLGQIVIMSLLLPYIAKRMTDWSITMIGLSFALIGLVGYASATQGWMIYVVFGLTTFEYLVHAPIRAIAAAQLPANAQGELQGAFTSISSITTVIGALLYPYIFHYFTKEDAPIQFYGAPFIVSIVMMVMAILIFVFFVPKDKKRGTTTVRQTTFH